MKQTKVDSLGDRMKRYEAVSKTSLVSRMPVILRIDGCHFHTFTRGFEKPFDNIFMRCMEETMRYLCENIQGCVLGYKQSDEITLVLVDYKKLNSSSWFDNEVQKMCSVAASMAACAFNKYFRQALEDIGDCQPVRQKYEKALEQGAYFDCRAFNVPKEDVCNCLLWRQQDATRNSIQLVAQANFTHKELQGLNCNKLQDKLFLDKSINWNDFTTTQKRGCCCIKKEHTFYNEKCEQITRSYWEIDTEIPIFSQNRDYIENLIMGGE
jgi:tRNA(His) 5'-end guanylyltransferase